MVESAFRIARHGAIQAVLKLGVKVGIVVDSRIAPAGIGHDVPALPQLARADGGHGAVMVGTVAEGVAQRDLLAVLRGACRVGSEAAEATKAGVGLAEAFDERRVAEGIVEAAPVGEDGTPRLGVVHRDAVDHHLAVLRVVAAHAVAQRAEVVGCNAVEHVARRVEQSGGVVDRSGRLLKVGIHQNHRRHVVLVEVGRVDGLGRKP